LMGESCAQKPVGALGRMVFAELEIGHALQGADVLGFLIPGRQDSLIVRNLVRGFKVLLGDRRLVRVHVAILSGGGSCPGSVASSAAAGFNLAVTKFVEFPGTCHILVTSISEYTTMVNDLPPGYQEIRQRPEKVSKANAQSSSHTGGAS